MTTSGSIVLNGVSWATYECLSRDIENRGTRLTFIDGDLEIVPPLPNHEESKQAINIIIEEIAIEWNQDILSLGSSNIRLPEAVRGFEPDLCYYIQNAAQVTDITTLNLAIIPPDLAVEVDLTHPSLEKLPLYAQIRVRELWRYTPVGAGLSVFVLDGETYTEREASTVLAPLTRETISALLAERFTMGRSAWVRRLRAWAQANTPVRPSSETTGNE